MSTQIKDGGAAFPRPAGPYIEGEGLTNQDEIGMSLRDWFAGMALQGMLANQAEEGGINGMADYAYKYADAMLKKREERP